MVLVPSVGGLLALVVRHGKAIAAIESRLDVQGPAIEQIHQDLRQLTTAVSNVAVAVEGVRGEILALRARTDELLRTTARHEQFLFRTDSDARAAS
jgi:hypothetical protein